MNWQSNSGKKKINLDDDMIREIMKCVDTSTWINMRLSSRRYNGLIYWQNEKKRLIEKIEELKDINMKMEENSFEEINENWRMKERIWRIEDSYRFNTMALITIISLSTMVNIWRYIRNPKPVFFIGMMNNVVLIYNIKRIYDEDIKNDR